MIPFWPTLIDRYTCTSILITLIRNLIYNSFLIYALRQTYLFKWFYYTWQELMYHFNQTNALSRHTSASDLTKLSRNVMNLTILTCDLFTLGRNLMNHSPLSNVLKQTTCYKFSIKLGRNLIYLSILTDPLRQTYLYKWFDHARQDLNLSFYSDLCP